MEVDDIDDSPRRQQQQQPASKYTRVSSNGARIDSSKIGLISNGSIEIATLEDKTNVVRPAITATELGGGGGDVVASTRFGRQWQHSSRIIRVSRASGGKDRHSKVWTAKGPRDRRVRLSVNTAIQFYDLQDRLGYDQPSKAVEWLIKAAADSINELPSLNNTNFPPETPRQLSDERRSENLLVSSADAELDCNHNNLVHGHGGQQQQQQQVGSMSKSGCSSNNSETSKGSGLSLSRTEIRVKARERARERTAKEKDKESEPSSRVSVAAHHHHSNNNHHQQQQPNVSSMTQTSSFTQLLTAGINNLNENAAASSTPSPHHSGGRGRDADSTTTLQWLSSSCTTPMADYFGTGLMGLSASRPSNSIQQQLGNGPLPHVMSLLPFSASQEIPHHHQQQQQHHHQQHHHFPFLSDNSYMSVPSNNNTTSTTGAGAGANGGSSDYNLNFSISSSSTTSGLAAGFNRGTLQSNSSSPSLLSYLQRFSTPDGGSSVPFFLGGAPISPVVQNQHNHHHDHHQQQFNPAGLQLCYGDGAHHSDQKGKEKN